MKGSLSFYPWVLEAREKPCGTEIAFVSWAVFFCFICLQMISPARSQGPLKDLSVVFAFLPWLLNQPSNVHPCLYPFLFILHKHLSNCLLSQIFTECEFKLKPLPVSIHSRNLIISLQHQSGNRNNATRCTCLLTAKQQSSNDGF